MHEGVRWHSPVLRFPLALACLFLVGCEEEPETVEIVRPVQAMKVQDVEGFVQRYFPGRAAIPALANFTNSSAADRACSSCPSRA